MLRESRCGHRSSVLAGIHCFRVHDAAEQLAVVRKLPSFLLQRPKVQLVADSVRGFLAEG